MQVLAGGVEPSAEGHLGKLDSGFPTSSSAGVLVAICSLWTQEWVSKSLVSVWSAFTDAAQSFSKAWECSQSTAPPMVGIGAFLSVAPLVGAVVAHIDFH